MQPIDSDVDRIATQIVDAAFTVHRHLGPGLLESIYEECLAQELESRRLQVCRQVEVPLLYKGVRLDVALRIDLLVERCIVLELKAVESLLAVHTAQVLTYLKLTRHRLGFLLNFNVPRFKDGIQRIIL